MSSVHLRKLLHNQETTWLALDLAMLGLLMVNLAWLIVDWLFATAWFPGLIGTVLPVISDFYVAEVGPIFWRIDLAFVALFLGEFLLRWGVAVRRNTYLRWYFYPFLHWYELLGCLPLAGFRALRFLRIFSMVYRLQKLGVIDVSNSPPARFLMRYYNVLVEEVADRVVVNVLEGVQHELRADEPVVRRILNDVALKRKTQLVEALGKRLEIVVQDHYGTHREAVEHYVNARIAGAVEESQDVERLKAIPVFGPYGTKILERTIAQIVFAVIDGAAEDLESSRNRRLLEDVVSTTLDELLQTDAHFDDVLNDMLIDAVDILKAQVRVQRWRDQFATDGDASARGGDPTAAA